MSMDDAEHDNRVPDDSQPESRPLFVEPLLRLKQLRSCLRPNDQPRGHDRFKSFRRTSSQGMAVLGSA